MIKKAMILAAGFGKRLHPLTLNCPKPLMKIGNETLLSNTLKFLEKYGIEHAVINVHYLAEQIVDYINKKKFNLTITTVKEENKILDTGGGVLNAINNFSNDPFIIINPDTIWNFQYLKELKEMDKIFTKNKKIKCSLLVVNKKKSFDQYFEGDFNLENNLIKRKNNNGLAFIYTGLQIIKPEVFFNLEMEVFSINTIWDNLIENNYLYGMESDLNFLHVSNLKIYQNLQEKNFKY